ncbi:hypothetical protein LIAUS_06210 [Leptospira interrogans]
MLSIITNPTNNWISRSIVGITTKSSVKLSSHPTTRPIGKRCVEFFNATCRAERCIEFEESVVLSFSTRPIGKRCVEFSNATCRAERCIEFEESVVLSFSYFWVGEVFFIRKTYFLQVKRLILVRTLEKRAFLSPERRSIESPFC